MSTWDANTQPSPELEREAAFDRFVIAFLGLAIAARLISIFATGFCDDEAYVVTIQRTLALSYFDHPPLHQWILHAFARAFGEGHVDRLPFLALNLLTSFALFGLARRLFSTAAGWWTVFAFNACLYFLVLPDGYIMPDQPLLAFLALGAWAIAEILYGPPGREGLLWAAAGLSLGLAGLSKYSAVFAPIGLIGFFSTSPAHRRWLSDLRPYLGAALGLACFSPALIWNAEHGWVSFAFQSGRAAERLTLDGKALRDIALTLWAQIGAMTPWIAWPLFAGLFRARRGDASSPERFLLWLAGPPLLFFALMPLLGQHPISHWFNSGWLFAFPLAGAWLADRSPVFRKRFAGITAALAIVGIAVYVIAVNLGPADFLGLPDPTRHNYDWPAAPLREAYARAGARFALIENWRVGGRLGVALGPEAPICAMGPGPQGYAFTCDASLYRGQNALIARASDDAPQADEAKFFESAAPIGELPIGRRSGHARLLKLKVGRNLEAPPPLPYGP
jgi:4-amino-4-deoxy-L-arabinose transferase-like glycosyltransferase